MANSPYREGLLNRRPTAALHQDRAYIDREQVVPYQEKHHKGKHRDSRQGPLQHPSQEPPAAALVVGVSTSRVVLLLRLHVYYTRVGMVGRQRGLGVWSHDHDHAD